MEEFNSDVAQYCAVVRSFLPTSYVAPTDSRNDSVGINNFSDFNSLLELLPRPLAHYMRLTAVVRASTTNLGATMADRLRLNASAAVRGAQLSFKIDSA